MKLVVTRVILIFSLVPAFLVGQLMMGFNSAAAQSMTPGNETGNTIRNVTGSNMTGGSAKTHLEEGIKALESGNIPGADMHLNLANQSMTNSPSDVIKHFEQGMGALSEGDTNGALKHLKLADEALG